MKIQSLACLILTFTAFNIPSNAKHTKPTPAIIKIHHFWSQILQSGCKTQEFQATHLLISVPMVLAGVFSFIASSISSAGGIGGGGLFIPILTIVAKLDLKTASSFSSFMVTGGSFANVMCNLCSKSPKFGGKSLIDYDIALSSEPCMLLGVSVGVMCNLVFPEWLITLVFALFLAWSTCKTCKRGLMLWKIESEEMMKNGVEEIKKGDFKEPHLLGNEENSKSRLPRLKLGVLLLVWLSFFSIYLFRGNRYGQIVDYPHQKMKENDVCGEQSIIPMEPCGVVYWILSSVQVPLAVVFTAWIVFRKESLQHQTQTQQGQDLCRDEPSKKLVFPLMALLAGILGGFFGIGGGMLISPLLLQFGIAPEITAATCSFMVFFSSTMSALQHVLMGMEDIQKALILGIVCFVASLVGLLVVKIAVQKYKRASLIVFSVSVAMALSIVLMTSFGVIKVRRDYKSGKYMGFKLPC